MEGMLFGLSVLAIAVIIHWSATNDRLGPDGRTKGLLAMRDDAPSVGDGK